ncbi:MAG: oligosaccharide flippase family protein [Thermodesulfovibrionales bacterium]|nr:oligosaccharide flippase family protein [Thermodesulfovibrionales bacterium]
MSKIRELQQNHLPEGSLRARFALGTFWSVAGAVISRGLSLLASIVVARVLGKVGFGELGIIQSTVGMFGLFAGLGLGMTATKHVAEFRQKDAAKAGRIIGLSFLVALGFGGVISFALGILAPWLAETTLAAPHLAQLLQIGAGILFFSAVNGVQTGALSGFEAFRTIANINLASGLLSFPLMVGGVYIAGLQGAVWGLVVSMAANCGFNYVALKNRMRKENISVHYLQSRKEWQVLWQFSLPAFLSGMMVGPVNWVCGALLVNQPNGYAEMGIYNAANQWRNAILFLPGSMSAIVLPMLSNLYGHDDNRRYKKVLLYNGVINVSIAFIVALIISLAAKVIMGSYGKDFSSGKYVLIVLAVSATLSASVSVIGQVIASSGRMWWGFILNLLWGIVLIFSYWLLISKGALGLAFANLIAYGVHLITVSFFAYLLLFERKVTEHFSL